MHYIFCNRKNISEFAYSFFHPIKMRVTASLVSFVLFILPALGPASRAFDSLQSSEESPKVERQSNPPDPPLKSSFSARPAAGGTERDRSCVCPFLSRVEARGRSGDRSVEVEDSPFHKVRGDLLPNYEDFMCSIC